ncbi:MFS transporter [Tropicimonas sediminicola]|uniref:Predicted arabinose efflux permease, MFS family n=1 Tax=Tropicimonas sediminicola TaxID=1031541 RepID=A0A239CD54_9RHOB|nr:MFS transporter [Tropicimonas sediminicola]SNS17571.1 Predicted arabinose efflux permease, MFS family [Tropicimonas sediminicola]
MPGSTFAPFRYNTYRNLWFASLVTNLGGMIQNVGAGWLMTSLSDNPAMVALVQGSVTLPMAVLSLLGGVFADNYHRRSVMIAAQAFMLVMSALLAVLSWTGLIGPWSLLAFTFAIGCGAAMHMPSWQASVGDLVPREHLAQAVMLNGMGFNLMRSTGPAVGGMIVAVFGSAMAFAINALTYLPVLFALYAWRAERVPDPLPREPLGGALRAGLRYVSLSADHLKILVRAGVFGFSAVAVLALMPLVASDLLKGSAATFGALLAAFGLGAVVVALTLRQLRERMETETIVRIGAILLALGLLGIGHARSVWLTSLSAALCGMAWQSSMALFNVATQLSTPRWVLGRVMSVLQVCTFGGMTIGSYVWGRVAGAAGVQTALTAAAVICLAGAALGFLLRLPGEGRSNLDPHGGFSPIKPALDIDMHSGPIKVSVEFIVPEARTSEFLALMEQRRVIRLRDGAHSWSLYRDLTAPDLWHESYRVPTWAAYLRHMSRRTTTDAENFKHLIALHAGAEPPRARRWIERPADPDHLHDRR